MRNGENRISLIKDVKITDGKADTIYSTLSSEIENCSGVQSLSRFGSDMENVAIGHKKSCLKIKKG